MTGYLPFLLPTSLDEWQDWLRTNGLTVVLVVAGLVITRIVVQRVLGRVVLGASLRAAKVRAEDPEVVERRVNTLMSTLGWLFNIFLALLGAAIVLDQLGVQVSALIAGVGVAGLAIGLAAQTLIKDVINGLFILVEGQYAVGDVVQVAGVSGQVIEITPRRTVLRDLNGHVHIIPNSAITVATNMTQGFARINLNVLVAYEEDLSRVIPIVNEECERLAADRPEDVLSTPQVVRVDRLADDGVELKVVGDVKAFKQWELAGELRRRLKDRFDREGIEIPYRHEVQVPPRPRQREAAPPPEPLELEGD
ncbi:mechanosensitive ion channel family protein [Tepidiforma sp.]|uniref:mechanosensitive ion channel family protein n=1 Tax=Tepidiforma sp. TaxID=2682230 RepID=UPI002ADD564E|nr:mechanosensitive ion channel family protein [Tepidiforma sp.]